MVTLLTPKNGETVQLLMDKHLRYIADPPKIRIPKIDWLNLQDVTEDDSHPLPVHFSYDPKEDGEIVLSPVGSDKQYVIPAKNGEGEIENLLAGTEYEWFVRTGDEVSEKSRFVTDAQAPRMLRVEGISNVRDFGAYRTTDGKRIKQELIYRTSEMDTHEAISEKGMQTLYDLGMRTDLDLRGIKDEYRGPVLDTNRVQWLNYPLAAYGHIFTPEQMELYRKTYDVLADESNYPMMVHCWGGIDRAGCWLYILGGMLGMGDADLAVEYELSSFSGRPRSRYSPNFTEFMEAFTPYGKNAHERSVNFLKACGVTEETMQKIRDILLEEGN